MNDDGTAASASSIAASLLHGGCVLIDWIATFTDCRRALASWSTKLACAEDSVSAARHTSLTLHRSLMSGCMISAEARTLQHAESMQLPQWHGSTVLKTAVRTCTYMHMTVHCTPRHVRWATGCACQHVGMTNVSRVEMDTPTVLTL